MHGYSERYYAALVRAACAHRNQNRKGGDTPYIVHPVNVSVIVLHYGFGEDVAIAALLHDIVEDQEYPLDQIEVEFGPIVAHIVAELTERKKENGRPRDWEIRKQEALQRLAAAGHDTAALKAADALDSVRSMAAGLRRSGPSMWAHFSKPAELTLQHYQHVAELVRGHLGDHPLAAELDEAVRDLEQAIVATGRS